MFTGLIQETGAVAGVDRSATGARIRVRAPTIAAKLKDGDSVAVSGVCLTALSPSADEFVADLAQETIARTSLAQLRPGHAVNLELPTPAGTPLGGHVVQGHVDGTGEIVSFEPASPGSADRVLELEIPLDLTRYIVEKGSIAVEGISLTVASISGRRVRIAIIPHTFAVTNLSILASGDAVNIEVDVLARYAEKLQAKKLRGWSVEELTALGF